MQKLCHATVITICYHYIFLLVNAENPAYPVKIVNYFIAKLDFRVVNAK
jgi:hypothetical protein